MSTEWYPSSEKFMQENRATRSTDALLHCAGVQGAKRVPTSDSRWSSGDQAIFHQWLLITSSGCLRATWLLRGGDLGGL